MLENLAILTIPTYKHTQNETVVVENYDKNAANIPFEIPKELSRLRMPELEMQKIEAIIKLCPQTVSKAYGRDDFLPDKHAFVPSDIINKSMRLRDSNTKLDTLQIPLKNPNLYRRPLLCTAEKYLNNFVSQRRVIPRKQTYANVVAAEKIKTCIIGDNYLARTT